MALSSPQKDKIIDVIKTCLRNKFKNYSPESKNMPFHYRLLGKDRMVLYSFIQSLNTTFGTSIFEPIAKEIGKLKFKIAETQYTLGKEIKNTAQIEIQSIMNNLSIGRDPDKETELKKIKEACKKGNYNTIGTVRADLYLEDKTGNIYLFDLKTVKPNLSNFKDFKRTLLEWAAILLSRQPNIKVNTLIAIPYNPYEPKPYERWTLKGMLDLNNELKVGEEFWDFLGGKNTYIDLLDCFEKAGLEMRSEIDEYFERFKNNRNNFKLKRSK